MVDFARVVNGTTFYEVYWRLTKWYKAVDTGMMKHGAIWYASHRYSDQMVPFRTISHQQCCTKWYEGNISDAKWYHICSRTKDRRTACFLQICSIFVQIV